MFLFCLSALGADAKYENIRKVDFKNFNLAWNRSLTHGVPVDWHWADPASLHSSISIKKGFHEFYYPGEPKDSLQIETVSVDKVIYGDLDGDGKEEAAVAANRGTANRKRRTGHK